MLSTSRQGMSTHKMRALPEWTVANGAVRLTEVPLGSLHRDDASSHPRALGLYPSRQRRHTSPVPPRLPCWLPVHLSEERDRA